MSLEHWLIYVSVVALIVVTPGPAAALCLSHGVLHGRSRTLMTVLGLVSSPLTLIALSSLGLGAILATSSTLFAIVKYVGAAYLIWLGVSIWRAPVPRVSPSEANPASSAAGRLTLGRLCITGFPVGISNPKNRLFFGALFPQFIEPGPGATQQLRILSSTWVVVAFAIMSRYATLGSKFATRTKSISTRRALNRVTGCVFVAARAALAWAKRWCLTLRSSGHPAAKQAGRETASLIIRFAARPPCRHQPLNSNAGRDSHRRVMQEAI